MFEVKITFSNALQDNQRLMTWPLVSVAQIAAASLLERVPKDGKAKRGTFRSYKQRSPPLGYTLVGESLAHPPEGLLFKTKAGRAAYRTYGEYKKSRDGVSNTKNFKKTGSLWRGLRIRVLSPTKVRINFAGRNASGLTNSKVAGFVQSREAKSILDLASSEVAKITKHVERAFPACYLNAQKINQMSFNAQAKLKRAASSLKRAKKAHDRAKAIQ